MRTMLVMGAMMVSMGLGGTSALAGKRTLVVGAGDCKDGLLLGSVSDFQDLARGLLKTELLEPDEVLNRVRPLPTRSLDDLERQVETARSLLYNAHNEGALELVNDALTGVERASPEVGPWPLTASALMLSSQINKALDRAKDSNEAMRRIVRVDPHFEADANAWPPSTMQALEVVRKEVQRSKKGLLKVSVLAGAESSVYVDGREVGKTPLRLELPQGTYRLSLLSKDAVSFPRVVNLGREEVVQVDMAFEGSIMSQTPLCASGDDARAIRLATTVDARRVVVLRNTAQKGNPLYVSGVLYDVDRGDRVRNAGIRPEQLRDLMSYLFTGRPDIVNEQQPTPKTPVQSEAPPLPGNAEDGTARILRNPFAPRVLVPAAIGAALLVGSGVFFGLALDEEHRLRGNSPSLVGVGDVNRAVSTGSTEQAVSFAFLCAGGVAVVTSLVFLLLGLPEPAPEQSLYIAPSLGGLTFGGRTP